MLDSRDQQTLSRDIGTDLCEYLILAFGAASVTTGAALWLMFF